MNVAPPLLEAQQISHHFSASDGQHVPALSEVSLALSSGAFTCLIGPSGCGKSTLLRILAGLIKPASGQVLLEGKPLARPQRRISIFFQKDNLMPWRTVYENIVLPLQLAGTPSQKQKARVREMLEITGLRGSEKQYPAELSGGMAQRVAIARGLITAPAILLMDEPFGALDALTREEMWEELLRIWSAAQTTVLMVTHSIDEALFLADRVLVMSPRPGTLLRAFDIPFARPRHSALLAEATFHHLAAELRAAIRR